MKKHYIIAIVGPSGSGKTTLSLAMQKAGIPSIVSYTTRPMREGEVNGREHWFITEPESDRLLSNVPPVAFTRFGGHRYFTLREQFTPDICSYVVDEPGLKMLQDRFESANHIAECYMDECRQTGTVPSEEVHVYRIIPVYVSRDVQILRSQIGADRLERDKERQALPEDEYFLHVCNDSPSVLHFEAWAEYLATALQATLGTTVIYPASFRTSESDTLTIINDLAKVQTISID